MSDNIDAQRLQEAMEAFVQTLHNGASGVETEAKRLEREAKELAETEKRLQDEFNKMHSATSKVTTGMTGMMKSIKDGGGSFAVLNDVVGLATKAMSGILGAVPVVGGALKAMGEAAGDVTKMMIDQYQQSWTAYKDIAQVGIADSFEHTRDIVLQTGLTFNELSRVLKPSSKALSSWSGNVADGTKSYQRVSRDLENVRRDFNALGVGAAEFSEMQLKYMEQEARYGRQNQRNLTQNTQEYIERLTTLSKLTGMQTKDLQAARDQAMSETRFRAKIDSLNQQQQDALQDMNAMITKTSPELAQGFRDLVAGGGVATTDAAKALVLKTGGKAIDEVRKVLGKENPGVKDIVGGVNNLKDAVKSGTKQFRGVAQYAGDANNALKGYAEAQNFANDAQVTEEDYKKIKKAMKDNVDGSNKQTKQLSETEMNLRDASIKMSLFATNAEIVNTAMETMSEGLDWISEKLFELSGQEMPEDFKARREERKSIQALSKERKELIELEKQAQKLAEEDNNGETKTKEYNRRLHGEMRKLDAQIAKKRESVIKADSVAKQATETRQQSAGMSPQEKRAEAVKNASSATGGTTGGGGQDTGKEESKDSKQQVKTPDAEKVSAALNDDKVIKSLFNFSGNVAGKLENFQKLDEDMKRRLVTAALEYREQTGGKGRLTINSAARSNEDQKKIAGGDRGKYAAKPGQSLHERGLAVDIQEYRDDKAMAALSRQGLTNQKVAGEPWHFQKISARQGFEGFVEGPQEGYKPDIELHGREKVKIEKDGENSTAELIKTFKELMTAMLEKQDDMLEHLETSAYNSEKLVRATV